MHRTDQPWYGLIATGDTVLVTSMRIGVRIRRLRADGEFDRRLIGPPWIVNVIAGIAFNLAFHFGCSRREWRRSGLQGMANPA